MPGRGPRTLPQPCLLQAGCGAWPCVPLAQQGVPVSPGVSIHPGELRPLSCTGPGSVPHLRQPSSLLQHPYWHVDLTISVCSTEREGAGDREARDGGTRLKEG